MLVNVPGKITEKRYGDLEDTKSNLSALMVSRRQIAIEVNLSFEGIYFFHPHGRRKQNKKPGNRVK
jgi:hypothetical protein